MDIGRNENMFPSCFQSLTLCMYTCDIYNLWNIDANTLYTQLNSFCNVGWMGTCEVVPLGMQS
jgi:hypothetical protein